MNEYTIIFSVHSYGHATIPCNKEDVRRNCENLITCNKLADKETFMCIEVVNNETGEIREYWNNKQDLRLF